MSEYTPPDFTPPEEYVRMNEEIKRLQEELRVAKSQSGSAPVKKFAVVVTWEEHHHIDAVDEQAALSWYADHAGRNPEKRTVVDRKVKEV